MRLKITCKGCRRNVEIEGELIQGAIDCPGCGTHLHLPSNVLSVDEKIGGFQIIRHLGSGAMGCVYLAKQLSMDRQVALKVLPPEMTEDQEELDSFMREIRVLGKLHHSNIVTAFEAGEDSGNYYMAMTYVEGETLEDMMERHGAFDEKKTLSIARKIAEALDYAWTQHGILHRDVKPANIMLDSDGTPKLLDMGLSKVHGVDSSRTCVGFIMGTPHYMSPEQAKSGREVDFRTDIYALGCTMYHMLTDEVPYDAPEVVGVLSRHAIDPIPSPKDLVPEVSDECACLLSKMMAKKPEHRHASWAELIQDIRRVAHGRMPKESGVPIAPATRKNRSITVPQPDAQLEAPSQKSDPTYRILVAVALALLAVFLGGILFVVTYTIEDKPTAENQVVEQGRGRTTDRKTTVEEIPVTPEPRPVEPRPAKPKPSAPVLADWAKNKRPYPLLNRGAKRYTIMLWVKTQSDGALFSTAPNKWVRQGKALFIRNGVIAYDVGWVGVKTGKRRITDGRWHHIVFLGGDTQDVWVDGRPEFRAELKNDADPKDSLFAVGKIPPSFRERSFNGEIDDLRFYDFRLNSKQIRRCQNGQVVRRGLIGYWTFDGHGYDMSGRGNNLKLQGDYRFLPGRWGKCFSSRGQGFATCR